MARTAEVMRDARIGEANAKQASAIEKCRANEILYKEKFKNDTAVAEAQRNYDIKKAQFDAEVHTQVCNLCLNR